MHVEIVTNGGASDGVDWCGPGLVSDRGWRGGEGKGAAWTARLVTIVKDNHGLLRAQRHGPLPDVMVVAWFCTAATVLSSHAVLCRAAGLV